jgi:hypothetical protein
MAQYPLPHWDAITSRQRAREVFTYLDWLDGFQQAAPDAFRQAFAKADCLGWLDVGAKNWAYSDALAAFIRENQVGTFRLDGIELDPHRRYLNFQTRRQAALAHSQILPNTTYHEGDVLQWTQPVRIISHFLPFVFREPHLAWGLPLSHFKPEAILMHELSLLEPDGLLLIVNQGEAEAEAQQALLVQAADTVPICVKSLGQLPARFIEYQYPRYGWICVKEGAEIGHARHETNVDDYPGFQE